MEKIFQRNIEDFHCENCGREVFGNGYTNHCPECLTSKHVDINPGDRASDCGGLMPPVAIDQKNGEFRITHRCVDCNFEKINRMAENDNFDEIIKLAKILDDKNNK